MRQVRNKSNIDEKEPLNDAARMNRKHSDINFVYVCGCTQVCVHECVCVCVLLWACFVYARRMCSTKIIILSGQANLIMDFFCRLMLS